MFAVHSACRGVRRDGGGLYAVFSAHVAAYEVRLPPLYKIQRQKGGRSIYKSSTLRKVFILEQPRICNMATIQKSLFFSSLATQEHCILDPPKGAPYLILPRQIKLRPREIK